MADDKIDAIDTLLATTNDAQGQKRLLDFVRRRFRQLKKEKKELFSQTKKKQNMYQMKLLWFV